MGVFLFLPTLRHTNLGGVQGKRRIRGDTHSYIVRDIERGSIPIVADSFQRPPLADWRLISVPLRYTPNGLRLPSAASTARMQEQVWKHRETFKCEPRNAAFHQHLARSLRSFDTSIVPAKWAGWREAGPQDELDGGPNRTEE